MGNEPYLPFTAFLSWSPMEKLILHLSPVTRRKSLRNSTGATSAANRRTMSEPNKNRMLLLNNGSSRSAHAQQHHNNGFVKKASLSSDLKAVAMVAVHEVYRVPTFLGGSVFLRFCK